MKVLEERQGPTWSREVVCEGRKHGRHRPGCGSRLLVEAADLTCVRDYDAHNGQQVAVFKCPLEHCGVETDLPAEAMPAWIFDSLVKGPQRGRPTYYGGGRD